MKKVPAFWLLIGLLVIPASSAHLAIAVDSLPESRQVPEWARQGRFRFTRLDGGPIEIEKTSRSSWGKHFSAEEREVLANLYGKYGDRMVDLLTQADINFVWVTYSVGFSWEDEAAQRAACREIIRKLHARGIKVAAYMCAVSIFWESLFQALPESVHWIRLDSRGVPFRYAGGADARRFIADIDNPEWLKYQKRRLAAIVDDGLDAIFLDNTGDEDWNSDESMETYLAEIRRYLREEKKSDIPLFTNLGLPSHRAVLNRLMDIVFAEGWREPGVWGDDWACANVRRTRYLRGLIPAKNPLITEVSEFHQGNRATAFLPPRTQQLAIAEAAAFNAAQARDMEGPFDQRLLAGDPAALESWKAIGRVNSFLKAHESLYVGARNVTPLAVLLPDNYPTGFAWHDETHVIFDFLARHSVLFDLRLASTLNASDLSSYAAVLAPFYSSLSAEQQEMIRRYQASGGKVYVVTDRTDLGGLQAETSPLAVMNALATDVASQKEVLSKIDSMTRDETRVALQGAPYALANVTAVQEGKKLVLHVLNYDPKPAMNVRVKLSLGREFAALEGHKPISSSPDSVGIAIEHARWQGTSLDLILPSLDVYSVVVLE